MKRLIGLAVAAVLFAPLAAVAQSWPSRPVTIVVPFPAGSGTDTIARLVAEKLAARIKQSVVVENRVGGASAVGTSYVAKADPDGYTLLMGTNSGLIILPLLQSAGAASYDPIADFAPLGTTAILPNILISSPKLPINSVADLIKYAKANPNKLSFSSSGTGTITHLIGEMFKFRTGIDVQHVPYRAGVASAPDLMEGRMDFLFDNTIWSLPLIREGKLRGLGITMLQRSPLAPEIPTIAEQGVPGFEGYSWVALFAPSKTPAPIVERLATELRGIMAEPEVGGRLEKSGSQAAAPGPEALRALMAADKARWSELIKTANIKVQ